MHSMNSETATAVCSYCQELFLAERMVIRCESLLLVIHPWCARALSQNLKESFDSWYTRQIFHETHGPSHKMNFIPTALHHQRDPDGTTDKGRRSPRWRTHIR